MEITPISRIEFEQAVGGSRGPRPGPFVAAIRALNVDEALSIPCQWKHTGHSRNCGGVTLAHRALGSGRVTAHCSDRIVSVLRVA